MVLFFVIVGFGWALTSILLTLVEVAFKRFYPLGEHKYLVMLNLLVGVLIILCLYYFLAPYIINTFSNVNASGVESDTEETSTNDNFAINSPLEGSSSENLMVVFQMVQLLLGLALILFILFVFLLWLKTKLDTVEIKSISSFWSLSEDLAEWLANGTKKFLDKSLKFYLGFFTFLILFNLSFALYFVTEMARFLSVFRF